MCSSFGWKSPPLSVRPGLEYKCHHLRVLTLRPPAMARASPVGIPLLLSGLERVGTQAGKVVPPFPEMEGEEGAVNTRSHAKA